MALTAEQQAAVDRVKSKKAKTGQLSGSATDQAAAIGGGKLSVEQQAAISRVRTPKTLLQKTDDLLLKIPGVDVLSEVGAGFNRGIGSMVDTFLGKPAQSVAQLAGSDMQVPFVEAMAAPKGTFVGEGAGANVLGGAGEAIPMAVGAGALLREGAGMLSPFAARSESAIRGVLRQAGSTTAGQDVALGAASGGGGAAGKEIAGTPGEIAGFFAAPLAGTAAVAGLKRILSSPRELTALTQSLSSMSDEGAARLLADNMVREGISPEEAAQQLARLGPNAIPADANNSFARLLRAAVNEIPRLQGRANTVLNERQAGQAGRLASALDDSLGVPGLNVNDEIERLRVVTAPVINGLYERARATPMALSDSLRTLLNGKNSLGGAFRSAQRRVADKRAAGDQITHFDLIDATKQELDDQIGVALRAGENNRARDLVRLKNVMVEEADRTVPDYKDARQMFAGRAALESAADQGTLFLKMNPREVEGFTQGMGESELRMFRLGAKQAILDKIDTLPVGADGAKRLFGKNGDVSKLRNLFPDEKQFQQFSDALEQEATFSMTRRAAQGNSTTAMQLADANNARSVMNSARALLGDPTAAAQEFGQILSGMASRKGTEANRAALERAGDILLTADTDPALLQRLLRRGDTPRLRALLQDALIIKPSKSAPALRSAITTSATQE
ncbi:MAG: cation-transporting P-type ATPase [Pseudomonadota bacterium]